MRASDDSEEQQPPEDLREVGRLLERMLDTAGAFDPSRYEAMLKVAAPLRASDAVVPAAAAVAVCGVLTPLAIHRNDIALLGEAVRFGEIGLAVGDPVLNASVRCLLSEALTRTATFDRRLAVLRSAVQHARVAAAQLPPGHRAWDRAQRSLLFGLITLSEATNDPRHADEAVAHLEAIRGLHDEDFRWRLIAAEVKSTQAALVGNLDRVREEIGLTEALLPHVRLEDPTHARVLRSLGVSYGFVWQLTKDAHAIEQAAAYLTRALEILPPGDPMRPGIENLRAQAHRMLSEAGRHERLGKATDAAERLAGEMQRSPTALFATRANHIESLLETLEYTQDHQLVEQVVRAAEELARAIKIDGSLGGGAQHYLSRAYYARYVDRRRRADLERSVEAAARSVAMVSATVADTAHEMWQAHAWHARTLLAMAQETRRRELLGTAAEAAKLALTFAPRGVAPFEIEARGTLYGAISYALLAGMGPDECDADVIDEAIDCAERAHRCFPPDHPGHAGHAHLYARALMRRRIVLAEETPRSIETIEAILTQGAESVASSTSDRLRCLRFRAYVSHVSGRSAAALDTLRTAVRMLPAVAPRELPWNARARWLAENNGLAGEIVVLATLAAQREEAIELVEQARGVLYGELLADRTAQIPPEYRDEFQTLRETLATTDSAAADHTARVAATRKRRNDAARLAEIIDAIRRDHPDENPFQPPTLDEMRARLDTSGPTVIVTCLEDDAGGVYSRALILRRYGQIETIELPELREADVRRWVRVVDTDQPNSAELRNMLAELWDRLAAPVIDCLHPEETRLWWSPVGPLALLPLHAAGHHRAPGDNVMDRVVSSYLPTLRALAPQHPPHSSATPRRLLLVPGGNSGLPATTAETPVGANLDVHRFDGPPANLSDRLIEFDVVHFSAHAVVSNGRPMASGIVFGDDDHATFTLEDVIRLRRVGNPGLAYLSACNTGRVSGNAPDEAIHLAAAFQIAGYPQVVATLWPVNDELALTVATGFYERCARNGHFDLGKAPAALHHSVRDLRNRLRGHPDLDRPELWAGYIHLGR